MSIISRSLPASLLVTAALIGCSERIVKQEIESVSAPTAVVSSSVVPETREVAARVRAGNAATLSARVVGNVTRVLVTEGDVVRQGQVLLTIDDRDTRAQSARAAAGVDEGTQSIEGAAAAVRAARANASLAQATLQRFEGLRERGSASPQEMDEVSARYKAAAADLERAERAQAQAVARRNEARAALVQAETFVDFGEVRAPFDGVVTARLVDPGAQAAPGVPLLTIEQSGKHRVEALADESIASMLRTGDRASVTIGGKRFDARIAAIVPAFDAATHGALVTIELPPSTGVQAGSFATAAFTVGSRTGVTIPAEALARRDSPASVFVVGSDGIARLRLVTTGAARDGGVEILSGLDPGERIVTRPANLRDGVRVTTSRADAGGRP